MLQPSKERKVKSEVSKPIIGLRATAYKEYLCARHLINAHFFQQAGIFMSSCLEKLLKAYLLAIGDTVNTNHDVFVLYGRFKKKKPDIAEKLNPDFLRVIAKIYSTRYYDRLGPGFNFVFVMRKFLAELDYSFSVLEPTVKIKPPYLDEYPESAYELDKKNPPNDLKHNNYLIQKIDKDSFLNFTDIVYEFRIASNHEIFECNYPIPYNRKEEKDIFIYEGLKQESESSFRASHKGYSEKEMDELYKKLGISTDKAKPDDHITYGIATDEL